MAYPLSSLAGFSAHEWGTFTSLVGSDGKTVHGLYHEDEKLPDFVHGFGVTAAETLAATPAPAPTRRPCRGKSCFMTDFYDSNFISQKMETPVIYFYANELMPQNVSVNVKFPNGILTETYPAPVSVFPAKSENPVMANGEMTFDIRVEPGTLSKFPVVDPGNIYGHARNVESNIVSSAVNTREIEKFIFYRGLGQFTPDVSVTSANGDLRYAGPNKGRNPQRVFLLDVDAVGDVEMMELNRSAQTVPYREIRQMREHVSHIPCENRVRPTSCQTYLNGSQVRERLIEALDQAGLNLDEATAMIDTWEHGYLRTPGTRMLYILPRAEVDGILPLTMTPAPDSLERVFVARLEILLDTDERAILADVMIRQDRFDVTSLGRFAEARLRRVLAVHEADAPSPLDAKTHAYQASVLRALIARAQTESFEATP